MTKNWYYFYLFHAHVSLYMLFILYQFWLCKLLAFPVTTESHFKEKIRRNAKLLKLLFYISALFQAPKIKNGKGQKDFYVDGGVLCNYPVHAFDGKAFCQFLCQFLSVWSHSVNVLKRYSAILSGNKNIQIHICIHICTCSCVFTSKFNINCLLQEML